MFLFLLTLVSENNSYLYIMLKFPYCIVSKLIKDSEGNQLPEIFHCVLRDGKYYKINSLGKYLKTSEGVSEEIVESYNSFLLINCIKLSRTFTF